MTRELLFIVVFANVLAMPLTYRIMENWLRAFPYRQGIGLGIFMIVLLLSMVIVLLCTGANTLKVAMSSSVHSLRNE